MAQMKEQQNSRERTKQNGDEQSTRCRVLNIGNKYVEGP